MNKIPSAYEDALIRIAHSRRTLFDVHVNYGAKESPCKVLFQMSEWVSIQCDQSRKTGTFRDDIRGIMKSYFRVLDQHLKSDPCGIQMESLEQFEAFKDSVKLFHRLNTLKNYPTTAKAYGLIDCAQVHFRYLRHVRNDYRAEQFTEANKRR